MEGLKKWNNRLEKIWLVIAIISTIIALCFAVRPFNRLYILPFSCNGLGYLFSKKGTRQKTK